MIQAPSLTCYGGAGSVTGANFLLEVGKARILVDCGLLQGVRHSEEINKLPFPFDPASIDYLFVTHSHIDHIGRIPKLVKDGFRGQIFSTPETRLLARLMLMDMAKIAEYGSKREGAEPIYGYSDVERSLSFWKEIPYHAQKDFADFKLELFDAGHILGSAMYKFSFPDGKTMLFTGDLGNSPSPLLKDTECVEGLDFLLMDSVYGDRNHEDKKDRDEKLKRVIQETIERGGTLLIPVFSLERTQILLYELNKLFEIGQLPPIPVFLDSPLAIKITEIYEKVTEHYKDSVQEEAKGDEIFRFAKLRETAQVRDAVEIAYTPGAKIILAGSGMSTAGRILGHEKHFLPDSNATVLFIGYQAPGTLGRLISDGIKEVAIDGERVEVRARVENIDGFSAHKDSDNLVDFVSKTAKTLKKVFIAMGEPRSSAYLAQRLKNELGISAVIVPEAGKRYELI